MHTDQTKQNSLVGEDEDWLIKKQPIRALSQQRASFCSYDGLLGKKGPGNVDKLTHLSLKKGHIEGDVLFSFRSHYCCDRIELSKARVFSHANIFFVWLWGASRAMAGIINDLTVKNHFIDCTQNSFYSNAKIK